MEAAQKLALLKDNGQDFEWYPTTTEMLNAVRKDLIRQGQKEEFRYSHRNTGISFNTGRSRDNEPDTLHLDSFIDIGAGDGRVFTHLTTEARGQEICIKDRFGIEKAAIQGDDLIKCGVALLGRDFYETVLIDRHFTVAFSNPPYSEYKEWTIKLLKEVNAKFIYLILPSRWKTDESLTQLFNKVGITEVIDSFDFLDGDRAARAKIDIIRVTVNKEYDTFREWVEAHIGKFETNAPIDVLDAEEERDELNYDGTSKNWLRKHRGDTVEIMVANYQEDLQNLLTTFKALGNIDWSLLSQLGVDKSDFIGKIRGDIKSLKFRYWRLVFDHMKEVTGRLTHKMRGKILAEIKWFAELDFNANNIRTIVVWIIDNFNKYTRTQMLAVYDSITDFNKVRAYKSNDKWLEDSWRYSKPRPTKYTLDYRIVVSIGYQLYGSYCRSNTVEYGNPIEDLSIVARSLGFDNYGACEGNTEINTGESYKCTHKGSKRGGNVLFEYKVYKNNNVHFKLDQEFLRVLNIEVGKERGWLKNPADLQKEFDLSPEASKQYFMNSGLQVIGNSDLLMLAAK